MSSATHRRPSSIADTDLNTVPALANGVRTPATIATRRPLSYVGIGRKATPEAGARSDFHPMPRADAFRALAETPYDVLVVGGGITGAGVARDAAMRGLKTALVERDDFGSGTSSRSSRLIHGGGRELEHR